MFFILHFSNYKKSSYILSNIKVRSVNFYDSIGKSVFRIEFAGKIEEVIEEVSLHKPWSSTQAPNLGPQL